MTSPGEPDLHNVDYEDVLHLYRGWRKSEGALKDKNKELIALKARVKQLQDSHTRFRGQIQALESVKELTISLQTQLSTVQQENAQLVLENSDLVELNKQAENMLHDRAHAENLQNKAFRDVQIEFAMLRGRYEEIGISQKNLEEMAADEQVMRMTAESRLQSAEETISSLREEIRALRNKLDGTTSRIQQSDQELAHASEHLATLSREVAGIADTRDALATAEAENSVLKGDISRLLRLLDNYPAAKGFLTRWRDSEGMSFIGVPAGTRGESGQQQHPQHPHTHNDDDDDFRDYQDLMSPSDVAHLKRVHGQDPFPVLATFYEEQEFWVPREAARLGMNFIASKIPHAPPSIILEFLRNMSKVWLRREQRKFARIQEIYEGKLSDMKRKLDHAKPYKQKIQERQIKRLKYQALGATKQKLTGHARLPGGAVNAISEDFYQFEEPDTYDKTVPPHHMRPCMARHSHDTLSLPQPGSPVRGDRDVRDSRDSKMRRSVDDVATEKLLEASLISLEAIGRQRATGITRAMHGASQAGPHPNESYLFGAIWLGRNMMMVAEELADSLDLFRNRQLVEVAAAAQDSDVRRSAHRLNLLAAAGITEAVALANTSKSRSRQIFQVRPRVLTFDTAYT